MPVTQHWLKHGVGTVYLSIALTCLPWLYQFQKELKKANVITIEKDLAIAIDEIPKRVQLFKTHTMSYLYNGYAQQAGPIYISLITWIELTLQPLFDWEVLQDNKALPTQLTKRLRSIQAELNDIVPEKDNLRSQIKLIQDATQAAESLPADLDSLKEARVKVDKFSSDAATLFAKISSNSNESDETLKMIGSKQEEAEKLVSQCEEAYRVTTSKGLAGAFDQRANKLSMTMWIWVGGLIVSLVLGGWIGSLRFEILTAAAKEVNLNWGVLSMEFILSLLGVAAPIWFAWIATKQISQRFKLSEDYAFKASVAKAYEGYRREAAKIDTAFEARLFGSALTRLEEAPLRVMDTEHHSSPWQELINSSGFKKALNVVPELKEQFMVITKDSIANVSNRFKKNDRNADE